MDTAFCSGAMFYAFTILIMKLALPSDRFSEFITSTEFWVTAVISLFVLMLICWRKRNCGIKCAPEENEREHGNDHRTSL